MPALRGRTKFRPRTRTVYIPSKFVGNQINIAGAGIETDTVPAAVVISQRFSPSIIVETDSVPGSIGIAVPSDAISINNPSTATETIMSTSTVTEEIRVK